MKMSESDVCLCGMGDMLNIVYVQFVYEVSILENPITNMVLLFIILGKLSINAKSES